MAVVEGDKEREPLIPGLPDEVAELCLLHAPYPYQALVRSVSSSWNRAITHPAFKKTLSRSYLFVVAVNKATGKIQWQALDPSSARWFVLPPMPLSDAVCQTSFACASLPRQGKLFVMGMETAVVYSTATNQWSPASGVPGGRSFFAAEEVNGRIVAVGERGTGIYDPEKDKWTRGAALSGELKRYEAAAVEGRVYVTEGWCWPFTRRPRGWAYDSERDTWREMREGLRDGWTGVSVAVEGKLFVIAEYGDLPVKFYDEGTDTWRCVGGDRFPREAMQRPFCGRGLDGKIYVISSGFNVAIGSVVFVNNVPQHDSHNDNNNGGQGVGVELTWQVVEAPPAFREFSPSSCQVLYA